ncbi:hypothetical protein IWQ62_004927, partial [Dispira parvispora]
MKTWRALLCVVVVLGSILFAAEAGEESLRTSVRTGDSNPAATTPLSTTDLRTESPGREKLPEGSKGGAGSTPSKTKEDEFDEEKAKTLTKVFTQWMEAAENVKEKKEIFEVYEKGISTARYIQESFDRFHRDAASKNDNSYTYHKALNQIVEDSEALHIYLASAKEFLESNRRSSNLLDWYKRKREKAVKRKEILDLEKRLDVVYRMKLLKWNFAVLLENPKVLDEESYKNLEKLKDN